MGFSISMMGGARIAPKSPTNQTQIRDLDPDTGISLPQLIEDLTPYSSDGRLFRFCQTPRVLTNLERGSAEDYARIFGGSGRTGAIASKNCAVVRAKVQCSGRRRFTTGFLRMSGHPAVQQARATTIPLTRFPRSTSPPKLNPVEPPWYGPYAPVGRGASRVSPYPIVGHSRLFDA